MDEEHGAENGARDARGPADDRHGEAGDHDREGEDAGRDYADGVGVKRARGSGVERREEEAREAQGARVDAER